MESSYTRNIQDLIYSSTEIMKQYNYLIHNELVFDETYELITTNMGILDGLVKSGFMLDLEELSPEKENFINLFNDVVEENQNLLDHLQTEDEQEE